MQLNAHSKMVSARCIAGAFHICAEDMARAVAVQHGATCVTYAELDRRSGVLAGRLMWHGTHAGDVVAVTGSEELDMIVAMLAVLKSGASYVVLSDDLSAAEKRALVTRLDVKLSVGAVEDPDLGMIPFVGLAGLDAESSSAHVLIQQDAEDIAYIDIADDLRTLRIPQRAVLGLVQEPDFVEIEAGERVLQTAPLGSQLASFEIWATLLNGGTLVLRGEGDTDLGAVLRDQAISLLCLTPDRFDTIARETPEALSALHQLVVHGLGASEDAVARVALAAPALHPVQVWGTAETLGFACHAPLGGQVDAAGIRIGETITGLQAHVLDADLAPVAPGVEGELCFAGPGLASGSSENGRFVEAPFQQGLLLHRTGLRACRRDGALVLAADRPAQPAETATDFLARVNATAHEVPDTTLTALLNDALSATPDAPALTFGDRTLSYAELDAVTAGLAEALVARGVGPDERVAIALPRSAELVIAIIAVTRAGGAYLPVNPEDPEARRAAILEAAAPKVLLAEEPCGPTPLLKPADWPATGTCLVTDVQPGNLAYVLYTSGSTGAPKGVMVEHRAIVNRVLWMRDFYDFTAADRILQKTPATFDVSVWEFFLSFLSGGALVVAPDGAHRDPREILRLIRKHDITALHFVPTMLSLFLDVAKGEALHIDRVFTSGEALRSDLRDRFHRHLVDTELHNLYGPTEAAVDVTYWPANADDRSNPLPIGYPVWNTRLYILDENRQPLLPGTPGRLWLAGRQLARGYLGREDLTEERFVADPFVPGERMYDSGDIAEWTGDGAVIYHGRADTQVKIRGMRLELGEVESVLQDQPGLRQVVVVARDETPDGDKRLVAFCLADGEIDEAALKAEAAKVLQSHAVPARIVKLDELPFSSSGKVNRRALEEMKLEEPTATPAPKAQSNRATSDARHAITEELATLLGRPVDEITPSSNFFDLGATSLLLVRLRETLRTRLDRDFPVQDFFKHTTIAALAAHLTGAKADGATIPAQRTTRDADDDLIAIIGMAGRFPGAPDVASFWKALVEGRELISHFTEAELDYDPTVEDPEGTYIRSRGALQDPELFDAKHFGFPPKEAELLDPQHRILLEVAQTALEDAGIDPQRFPGRIGVFAGASQSSYLLNNILSHPGAAQRLAAAYPVKDFATIFGNDKDFLSTRLAYKLNLRGPAITVQCACSTSLVAVAQACEAIQSGRADMALAGGVSITFPTKRPYAYLPEGMTSADGHCRTFDAQASGTVFGDGAGIVVLRRLKDAIAAGDEVIAVIRGFAINNDGSEKAGYAAPSIKAQAEVIRAAHLAAGVEPRSISYVEAHGTATPLGDPIEFAALSEAFGTGDTGYCALGSTKTNVGHLDIAAGVTGLIKTALSLKHGQIPALLHYTAPNPRIDFDNSAFFPVTALRTWEPGDTPRRAGISALGVGGTNIHMVLEEAPMATGTERPKDIRIDDRLRVFPISGTSADAVKAGLGALADWARENTDADPDRVAATLRDGRIAFPWRSVVLAPDMTNLGCFAETAPSAAQAGRHDAVAFLFPGQGAQHVGMARELFQQEKVFREALTRCCTLLEPELGLNLLDVIHAPEAQAEEMTERLKNTALAQPAIFSIGYALAKQWAHWGIEPDVMVGHSIGEFAAATIAGVFKLEDALKLIALRGRLMADLPRGVMVSVRAAREDLEPWLGQGLDLAAVNGANACVLAGPEDAADALLPKLEAAGFVTSKLHTSHAFHSQMMEPALAPFRQAVAAMELHAPQIPIMSTVLGDWLTADEATNPDYWASHMRRPVMFHDAISRMWELDRHIFLETGPGRTLSTLARQKPGRVKQPALSSLPHAQKGDSDSHRAMLETFGMLWANGLDVDWSRLEEGERPAPRKLSGLPTYPFQRKRFWVEPYNGPVAAPIEAKAVEVAEETAGLTTADAIRAMLEELSGIEAADMDGAATFLELGFDSLLLTQATRELTTRFGAKLSLRQLISDYACIDALAEHVDAHGLRKDDAVPATEVTAPKGQVVTATIDPQREIWAAMIVAPEVSPAYNQSFTLKLDGTLDRDSLCAATETVIARHDGLRATFSADGETMTLNPELVTEVPVVDLTALDDDTRAERLQAILADDVTTAFDLENAAPVRASLVAMTDTDHRLILTAHHIVCDGWSIGVLMREIGEVYTALREDRTPQLPAAQSLLDYARAEAEWEGSTDYETSRAYWKDVFAGDLPPLDLPTDRPRAAVRTVNARRLDATLDRAAVATLRKAAAKRGATLSNMLLAGFQMYLARITGLDDITIAVPAAGQASRGMPQLVGHCVNLMPVRMRLDRDTSVAAYLADLRDRMLDAVEHQHFSYGAIVRELRLARDPGRVPLAPVMFNLDNAARDADIPFGGATAELTANPRQHENFEMFLALTDTGEDIRVEWTYNSDLWDHATMERHLAGYATVLARLSESAEVPLADILAPSAEDFAILGGAQNGPATAYPNQALHMLVAARAAMTPDAPAVEMDGAVTTYDALDRLANRIAQALIARGMTAGDIVGVSLTRGMPTIASMLGVMKAGGTYLPLDPSFPPDRLEYMVDNSKALAVIVDADTRDIYDGIAPQLLDLAGGALDGQSDAAPDVTVDPEALAYVLYTSGSTGKPKGVAIPHRAFVNFITSMAEAPGLEPDERFLAVTTVSFDIAGLEIWGPLVSGGTVVLVSRSEATDGERLLKTLTEGRIDRMQATPATWRMLIDAGWQGTPGLTAMVGGEALPEDLAKAMMTRCDAVWNMYGPTETTVWSTIKKLDGGKITIGRPIANTEIAIADTSGRPVAPGVAGELLIGGDGLAQGYLFRDDLTEERFVAHPDGTPGKRLYRTGDLARWIRMGETWEIECLGRIDNQVKLRGYRIELGEIESALADHEDVAQAVVDLYEFGPGDKRLVGWIIPEDHAPEARDLRAHLSDRLPSYMVPGRFVMRDAFPLTPNGKIDRKALRAAPIGDTATAPAAATGPEAKLVALFREVLGTDEVQPTDGFFELGGHSLLPIKLMAAIGETFGATLPITTLFLNPSPRLLAGVLGGEDAPDSTAAIPEAPGGATAGYVPTTEGQREIIGEIIFNPDQVRAYNMPVALDLNGAIDEEAMQTALAQLIDRHAALRARFSEDGMEVRFAPVTGDETEFLDLSHDTPEAREARLAELHELAAHRDYDLRNDSLFHATLIKLAGDRYRVLFATHHLICDGWSISVLFSDLRQLYLHVLGQGPAPEPAASLADMSAAEAAWKETGGAARDLDYWVAKFPDVPVTDMPTDHPRGRVLSNAGAQMRAEMPAELIADLRAMAKSQGASLENVLFAAFNVYIARLCGAQDLVIGLPSAGQLAHRLESAVGHSVNFLPIRNRVSTDDSFAHILKQVRFNLLEALDHRKVTLGQIVRELKLSRDQSRSALAPVAMSFDNMVGADTLDYPGIDAALFWPERPYEHFELIVYVAFEGQKVFFDWSYSTALFDAETIRRHIASFQQLLGDVAKAPEGIIAHFARISAQERRLLLEDFQGKTVDHPQDDTFASLFAAQVRRAPEATALIEGDRTISFARLDRMADAIAARLIAKGVTTGDRVGINLDRSAEAIAAMLATARLGAAFVALDPANPADRLNHIAADAGLRTIVSLRAHAKALGQDQAITLDDLSDAEIDAAPPVAPAEVAADDTCYVAYTSGSTGLPKGVVMNHRATMNRFHWMWRAFPFEADEVMCHKTTLTFVDSIWEIFGPLLGGVPLVIIDQQTLLSPVDLLSTLGRHRVTRLLAVPSLLRMLIDAKIDIAAQAPALRMIFSSGERLTRRLATALREALPAVQLVNLYGSSEIAADVTCEIVETVGDGQVPIGRPIDNVRLYVLDGHGQLVQTGLPGELHVGGPVLATGYHGLSELTNARFLPDPFSDRPGARMFATGDLVRWRTDGRLEYIDRLDQQVKLRGVRIELGEIEAQLKAMDGVKDAVALVRADDTGEDWLIAYVTGPGGRKPKVSALRRALAKVLPDYMVPQRIVALDEMPRGAAGKTDRRALQAIEAAPQQVTAPVADSPVSATEANLRTVWEKLLSFKDFGRDDNFFDLGGHSLMAVRMFTHIHKTFQLELPIATLITYPTLRGLADHIDAKLAPDADHPETEWTGAPEDAPWDTSVVMDPGPKGTRNRPLFIVGGVGGNVNDMYGFGRKIGRHRPIIGLQTRGIMGHRMHDTIEETAADHIRYISKHQPEGRILLAGFSGGSLVAYEIAQQLTAQGEPPEYLGLLDMHAPGYLSSYKISKKQRLQFELKAMREQGMDWVYDRVRAKANNILMNKHTVRIMSRFVPGYQAEKMHFKRLIAHTMGAYGRYKPGIYHGDIGLYMTSGGGIRRMIARQMDPYIGWGNYIRGEIHTADFAVNHVGILYGEAVEALANIMEDHIRNATGEDGK